MINLTLQLPNGKVIKANVDENDSVNSLNQIISSGSDPLNNAHTFYFNGSPLCPAFSLKWYGICDDSKLYVDLINPNKHLERCRKFKEMNQPIPQEAKKKMINSSVQLESSKIKDLFFSKIEGTNICYRKMIKRFIDMTSKRGMYCISSHRKMAKSKETILMQGPDQPSTDVLPVFWNSNDCEDDKMEYSPISSTISSPIFSGCWVFESMYLINYFIVSFYE